MDKEMPDIEALKVKAESGDVNAQRELAHYFYYVDSKYNHNELYKWSSMAAKQKDPEGLFLSGILTVDSFTEPEIEQGFNMLLESVQHGYIPAIEQVGIIYERGAYFFKRNIFKQKKQKFVIKQDYEKACELYEKYHGESAFISFRYATLILERKVKIHDDNKAFELMLNSAQKNFEQAINMLSYMYYKGIGTEVNDYEAYTWSLVLQLLESQKVEPIYMEQRFVGKLSDSNKSDAEIEAQNRFNLLSYGRGYEAKNDKTILQSNDLNTNKRDDNPGTINNSFNLEDVIKANINLSIELACLKNSRDRSVDKAVDFYSSIQLSSFNPSDVSIKLSLKNPTKTIGNRIKDSDIIENIDLDGFYVFLNKDKAYKDISLFSDRIGSLHRKCLIQLAYYTNAQDTDSMAKILEQQSDETLSRLNTMFKQLFPHLINGNAPFIGREGFKVVVTLDHPEYISV